MNFTKQQLQEAFEAGFRKGEEWGEYKCLERPSDSIVYPNFEEWFNFNFVSQLPQTNEKRN